MAKDWVMKKAQSFCNIGHPKFENPTQSAIFNLFEKWRPAGDNE